MKTKYITYLLFCFSTFCFAQISTTKMNELKIGMRPAQIMKLLGNKPTAIADNNETNIKVNGINYTIYIQEGYLSKGEGDTYLGSISTTSKVIKTLSGVGVGSTVEDLWNAYSSKYNVFLSKPENNFREFRIQDEENGTMLIFELKNEIVTKININSYNPEECTL